MNSTDLNLNKYYYVFQKNIYLKKINGGSEEKLTDLMTKLNFNENEEILKKVEFKKKQFNNNGNYVDLDIQRFQSAPFQNKPQVPLFHPYHTLTEPFTVFKIDNIFYDNLPESIRNLISGNIERHQVDIFFVVNYKLPYEDDQMLFRPQYYYIPHEGVRGNKGESITFTPYAGIYGNSKQITSKTDFIGKFTQIDGLSAHDNKISSNTHPMNWNDDNIPLYLYSIVNGANGDWSKCAVTLHWIVDFVQARDFREKARDNDTFEKLIPILRYDPNYNDLFISIETLLN